MVDASFQLLIATFPTILFFISLIPRLIVHLPQRKGTVREIVRSVDKNFAFNLVIDSFALAIINGLILMFQFSEISWGFVFMFVCMALCVFGFSSLYVESVQGAVFVLFVLGVLFLTEFVFFLQSILYLLWVIPAVIFGVFFALVIVIGLRNKTRHAPPNSSKPQSP